MKRLQKKLPHLLFCTFFLLFSVLLGTLSTYFFQSDGWLHNVRAQKEAADTFDGFTHRLFQQEVTANTLNLHYLLAHPENYGIKKYPVTLGSFTMEAMAAGVETAAAYEQELKKIPYDRLDEERQITYDCILQSLSLQKESAGLLSYTEILSASGGFQAQLPVLLSEYTFYDEADVETYLELVSSVKPYFEQIVAFEKEKSRQGLFMSDFAAEAILEQCRELTADVEHHFLITTFEERLGNLSIPRNAYDDYCARNKQLLSDSFFPAYDLLCQGLRECMGSGKNPYGLCYYPKGREYYTWMVQLHTGCSDSPEQLYRRILESLQADLSQLASLPRRYPSLQKQLLSYQMQQTREALGTSSDDPEAASPTDYLDDLKEKIRRDFPPLLHTRYQIARIDASMERFLSPAFYLMPTLDETTTHSIYINHAHHYTPLSLYTTLAHEGFPGHLYQNVYTNSLHLDPVRSLFGTTGYAEGWATYGEMFSYSYLELEEPLADWYRLNSRVQLALSSAMDLGIHYFYWTPEDAAQFLSTFGVADEAAVTRMYEYIVAEPGNYLNYYVGYLEFMRLQQLARQWQGKDFSLKDYHKTLLQLGEAPFDVLEEHLRRRLNK